MAYWWANSALWKTLFPCLHTGLSSPGDSPMPSPHASFCALVTPPCVALMPAMFNTPVYYHMSPFSASSSIGYSHHQCALLCRETWSWPGLAALRGMHHRFFQLELWLLAHHVPSSTWETKALPQAMKHSGYFVFLCMFPQKSRKHRSLRGQLFLDADLLYPL